MYENQDYGSRPRRQRYESYGSPPRSRPRGYEVEERPRKPTYRDEGRSRYRDYDDDAESRQPRRKDFRGRNNLGPSRRSDSSARPCKVLGVFGLSIHTTERDLYNIFSSYGRVRDIQMVYDHLSGRSRGFAFVYYESTEDAQRAKSSCEGGLDIDGKIARVDYSLTAAPHNPTPGVYMGKMREQESRRSGGRFHEGRPPHRGGSDDRDRGDYKGRSSRYERGGGELSRYEEERRPTRSMRDRSPIDGGRPTARSSRADDSINSGGRRRRRTLSSSRSRSPPPVYANSHRSNDIGEPGSRRSANSGGGGKVLDEGNWSDD